LVWFPALLEKTSIRKLLNHGDGVDIKLNDHLDAQRGNDVIYLISGLKQQSACGLWRLLFTLLMHAVFGGILGLSVVLDAGADGDARDYFSDTLVTTP
jgi:hypothetical protein